MANFKDSNFFVGSADPEVIDEFKKRYKNRIIVNENNFDNMQNALIDMYCFAKSKYIIKSYVSSFADLSWWIGGCRSTLIIVPV
jgi:predicted RecB family nuclease